MTLHEQINDDLKAAMKAGNQTTVGVLRMVHAAVNNARIERRGKGLSETLSEEDVQAIVQREVKKRKEAAALYRQGGRADLADQEERELRVLGAYMPQQLSDAEVRAIVTKMIAEKKPATIGEAMKVVMAELKGKADSAVISAAVKECLS